MCILLGGHSFTLSCSDFESKKIWVNLNLPIKARVDLEPSDVLKTTDERKYIIQATIIR